MAKTAAKMKPEYEGANRPEFALCRGFNHEWPATPDSVELVQDNQLGLIIQVYQKCRNCTAERSRYLNAASGVRIKARLAYPNGYIRHGHGRMTVEELGGVRLDWMRSGVPGITRKLQKVK